MRPTPTAGMQTLHTFLGVAATDSRFGSTRTAHANGQRVNLCYKSSRPPRIADMASVGVQGFGSALIVDDAFYEKCSDFYRMRKPLPASRYGKPVAELYDNHDCWSFYGVYLADRVNPRKLPTASFVGDATKFFAAVLRAAAVSRADTDEAYAEAKSSSVRKHLARERSGKLAALAKMRDGYTCQVCGINFKRLYGPIGLGLRYCQ